MEAKKRKKRTAAAAAVMAVVLALSGTFAWQSISQRALNETQGLINPGGRLHDDFDGTNKDVYVENFTDPDDGGVSIYARVRLDEYMEMGEGAGLKTGDTGFDTKKAKSLISGADIDDTDTWRTHIPGAEDDPFQGGDSPYWKWELGGSTTYMPTFNKNKDSLKADINGTYANNYEDYVDYTNPDNATKTDNAVYDADEDNNVEEDNPQEGVNITTKQETHNVAQTKTAAVMTMEEWITAGAQPGAYWVYDVDGWAYWAEAIKPGETTGLLLDEILIQNRPQENWYYAINVVGQFATQGDWGSQAGNDGFFGPTAGAAPTDNAIFLLNQAAAREVEVKITAADNKTELSPGETLAFSAEVLMGEVKHLNQNVTWSVEGATSAGTNISDGTLTVGADEQDGSSLTIKAQSVADTNAVAVYRVKIVDLWPDIVKEIEAITPGDAATVTIDGIEWYVLVKEDDKAMILSKDILEKRTFHDKYYDNKWSGSKMQEYLNGGWLASKVNLSAHALETTIKTRSQYDSEDFDTTMDKVFLLSEADVFGKFNNDTATVKPEDYTYNGATLTAPGGTDWRAHYDGGNPVEDVWFLRSPRYSNVGVAVVTADGTDNFIGYDVPYGVRPALWVSLS